MNTAKPLICLLTATMALLTSAQAGGSGSSVKHQSDRDNPWTTLAWHVHTQKEYHGRAPLIFLGRVGRTLLQWPQILSETIEGDRVLVNKRGVLGTREVPAEDTVYSPEE